MAKVRLSVDDLSVALDCAIAMLDGMDSEEVAEFFGDTRSPESVDALMRRLQAAYGTITA